MEIKDRLERVATVLTTTEYSPSPELHDMGLRLLEAELRDLDRCTREREAVEVEAFRAFVAAHPERGTVSRICDESEERVRRIMRRQ